MRIPTETKEFAVNMSNMRHWQAAGAAPTSATCWLASERPARQGLQHALGGEHGRRRAPHPHPRRHLHATRCDNRKSADKGGRLRLMYEANPMSLIVEQAGGVSTNGHTRILDIQPEQLHQRVAVFLGSKQEVERVTSYHQA
jgi:fructose-1,6-bisphosphatase I